MDLSLTEEQSLLRDSARRFLADQAKAAGTRSLWPDFAELGWLALTLPDADGGMAPAPVETALIAEELGRHLVVEPWVASIVLATSLLVETGAPDLVAAHAPGIIAGTTRLALAHLEPPARACLSHVAVRANPGEAGWRLHGTKTAVIGAEAATHLLVTARTGGDVRDRQGIALFLLPRTLTGLDLDVRAAVDGSTTALLHLHELVVPGEYLVTEHAFAGLERAADRALTAWCAEAVGAMDALLAATIDYTRTRVQFGRALAANQAVRHRLADMAVALEEARSLTLKATLSDDAAEADRARTVAAARVKTGRSARYVAEQAVQLHGGMGVTEELPIGAYLRRVLALNAVFGSPEEHLRRHVLLRGKPA